MKTTRFGWGKKIFLFGSLGLAVTELCFGGRGEFFRMDLIPKGKDKVYGC